MLTLAKTHTATLKIDDEPVLIHVKRMTKSEAIAFERDFFKYGQPRGTAVSEEEHNTAARQFLEDSIAAFITVAPDHIVDDGRPVVSGEDVIRAFCARSDVLGAFYRLIYSENFLGKAQKKILTGLPFFSPGSQRSILGLDGERPELSAEPVESSGSASPEDATASSDQTPVDGPESSGTAVH